MGKKTASPQLENGYTRVANELLEALSRVRLTAYAHCVLVALIREIYGFQVKSWPISEGRLAKITGLARANVHRALCELKEKNIIECLGTAGDLGLKRSKGKRWFDPRAKVWRLQKDYTKWEGCRQVAISREATSLSPEKQHRSLQRSDLGVHKESKRKLKKEERDMKSPPPKKKKGSTSPKKKRTRDHRLDHPALKIYRGLAHLTAPAAVRDDMVRVYEDQGEARWEWAVKEWIGRGYNPKNVLGMIDVARNGFKHERGGEHGEDRELRYQDALGEA